MYKLHFCSQQECRKCIFWQSADLNFKKKFIHCLPLGIPHEDCELRKLKKLNLLGKTAIDESAWIKAYLLKKIGGPLTGASLALVGNPSSDGVTMKMPYGVDVLHQPALHPIFSYWVG